MDKVNIFCDLSMTLREMADNLLTRHTAKLYYIDPYVASGGKLRPWLAKNLLCFLAWIKVASLQDIAVNDEGGKFLQKLDLQY